MKIRAIITGVTGMVGEGVLHECLVNPEVEQVLVINRKTCGVSHPKLLEILHTDFFDFSSIELQLQNYTNNPIQCCKYYSTSHNCYYTANKMPRQHESILMYV